MKRNQTLTPVAVPAPVNAGKSKNYYKIFKINKFIFYLCNNRETTPFEIGQWVLKIRTHTLCNLPFSLAGRLKKMVYALTN
jgi:hypothetical protein